MRKLYIVSSRGVPSASKAMQALKDAGIMANGDTWYSKQALQDAVQASGLGDIYTSKPIAYADIAQCTLVLHCESISGYLRLLSIQELGTSRKPSNYQSVHNALTSLEYRHATKVALYESLLVQLRREEQE